MQNKFTVLRSIINYLSAASIKIFPIGSAKQIYGVPLFISWECLSTTTFWRCYMLISNAPHLAFEGYQRYAKMYLAE